MKVFDLNEISINVIKEKYN